MQANLEITSITKEHAESDVISQLKETEDALKLSSALVITLKETAASLEACNNANFACLARTAAGLETKNTAELDRLKDIADDLGKTNSAKIDELQLSNNRLTQENNVLLQGLDRHFNFLTVGSMTLKLLNDLSCGKTPSSAEIHSLQMLISSSSNLWAPVDVNKEISTQVSDADVASSLIDLVGVSK